MAVVDKYVEPSIESGARLAQAIKVNGGKVVVMAQTVEILAAEDNGSVYRFFKDIPSWVVPIDIKLYNDAIAAGTDWDLGFYRSDYGAVISKDALVNGADFSTAHARSAALDGLSAVDISLIGSSVQEIIDEKLTTETRYPKYDVGLTANTIGTAAGTVSIVATFAIA
jgi:hypothetical protein